MRITISVAVVAALVAAVVLALTLFRGEDGAPPETTGTASTRPSATATAPEVTGEASFDVVRVAPGGGAVIAGRTEPGAKVTVRAGEVVIGEVTADDRGEWVLVPVLPLPGGAVELSQEVRVPGREPFLSEQVVVIVLPERVEEGSPEQALVVRTAREGGASEVLQGAESDLPEAPAEGLSLSAVDYGEEGKLVLSGKAEPGASVRVYIDNELIGTARAGAEGKWRLEPVETIAPGAHGLRVDQLGAGGRVAVRIEVPFSRAGPGELVLAAGTIVVQPGNSLWRIARAVYGQGPRYSVIYQANSDQIRDPDLIYPGQVFTLPDVD